MINISHLKIPSFSNRIRACVNIMGDAYGAGIIEHLSRAELAALSDPNAVEEEEDPQVISDEGMVYSKGNGSVGNVVEIRL